MKERNDLLSEIEAKLEQLTEKEREVARFIIRQPSVVAEMTISQLASSIQVSDPTVTRFCKKFPFQTYNKLRALLVEHRSVRAQATKSPGPYADLQGDYQRLMEKSQALTDAGVVARTTEAMHSARKIHLFGMGSSGLVCMLMKGKFMRTGLNIDCYPDAHMMRMAAATLYEGDIVFCVSVKGTTTDVVHAAEIAQARGARIITMTSQSGAILAQMADEVLLIAGNAGLQTGDLIVSTEFPFMYVSDILFQSLLLRDAKYEINYRSTILD
ncbi:MAG: MurR/RpiR family transcriptional regulator [Bacilli bacterium]